MVLLWSTLTAERALPSGSACAWPGRPDSSWTLPHALHEISGLTMAPGGRLLTHNDEHGRIHALDPRTGGILGAWSLQGEPAEDFEGIAVVGTRIFLVTSRATLYEAGLPAGPDPLRHTVHRTGLEDRCEFEGLAADLRDGVLLLPCKLIRGPDRRSTGLRVYRWDVAGGALAEPASIELSADALREGTPWKRFAVSSIELDARTGNLWLLSARQRGLLELSREGAILSTRELAKEWHRQPEGLAILADGSQLVSDEGDGARATLSLYRCR